MWTQTSPSSNPNSPDLNFGHEQCEVSHVGELNVGMTEFVKYKYNYYYFLSFTAAVDQPEPHKPTERPQPESRGRIGLYVGLIAAGLTVCVGLFVFRLCSNPDVREHAVEYELENMDAAE